MSACPICQCTAQINALHGVGPALSHDAKTVRRRRLRSAACCGSTRSLRPLNCAFTIPTTIGSRPTKVPPAAWRNRIARLVLRDHVRFASRALRSSQARGPLLDVGCGGGLFLGMMRERGFRVLGLDFSREAASIAWRRQQAPAVCAMLENAPIRPEALAGLTMFHVLEHLYDPRAYLAPPTDCSRGMADWWYRFPTRPPGSFACWGVPGTAWTCLATWSIFATAT